MNKIQSVLNTKVLQNILKNNFSRRQTVKPSFKQKLEEQKSELKINEEHNSSQQSQNTNKIQQQPEIISKPQKNNKKQKQNKEQSDIHVNTISKYTDEQLMAQQNLSQIQLPKHLQKKAQQVFNKYHTKDVRIMGDTFMKLYQQIHAKEKPQDILALEPFQSTQEVQKQGVSEQGNKIYLRNPSLSQEQASDLAEEHRREKVLKQKQNKEQKLKENENLQKTNEEMIMQQNMQNTDNQLLNYTQNMAIAYLLRKVPFSYAVAKRIINEISRRKPNFQPKTFLDYGSGLGQNAHLIQEYFPSIKKQILLEPSTIMRKLGKHITSELDNSLWVDNLARLTTIPNSDQFDIVLCSYVLEEVPTQQARQIIIEQLWRRVSKDGILIVIEPGSPMGSRFVHDVRKYILDKQSDKPSIIAPCPHKMQCPLAQNPNSWCHFQQQVITYDKQVFPQLSTEKYYKNEKYSYIVLKKGELGFDPSYDNALTYQKSYEWQRIMFPQIKKGGHILFDLCTFDGKFDRRVVSKSQKDLSSTAYKELKKLKWGDLWQYQDRIPNKFRKEGPKSKRLW